MIQNTLLFTTKFNVVPATPKFVLTDLSPYGSEGITLSNVKGVFKIEGPTGIIYNNTNFGAPDITGNVSLVFNTVSIPIDTNGDIINGDYKITYTVQIAGGVQPGTYTFIDSSNYCYVAPTGKVKVTNSVRLATVTSSDLTTYAISGVNPTLTRTHTLYYPSALVLSPLVGSTAQLDLAYPNVYSGTYTGKLSTTASYVFPDGLIVDYLVSDVDESIVDGSTLCDIYCGLKSLTTEFISAENTGDFGKSGVIEDKLSTIGFLLNLYDQALTCGKPDDATTWLNEVIKIAGITPGCGCDDDTPVQIIPIGGGSGSTAVVLGDSSFGTQVAANTVGSTTTYTVRLTDAYKALILGALQSQDLSVSAFRAAGIPEEARGVQVSPLLAGGSTISLTPGTSKKILVVTGNPTLSGSTTIQTVGTPIDGDSFLVDYRATATPNGQTVTIFGLQLSPAETASGNCLVQTWYASSTSTWYAKLINNTQGGASQDGLVYWQNGPDYALNKAVLYGSNPSFIYKNIISAGSGTNPPTGTTGSNTYWQYVGNKSILSDASDNIVFDVTSGKPFILPSLNTTSGTPVFLTIESNEIKSIPTSSVSIAGTILPTNNIFIGSAGIATPVALDSALLRSKNITGITGSAQLAIVVAPSGSVSLVAPSFAPTIKVTGTTTLTGSYSITPSISGAIVGDYFWVDYNAQVTRSGNSITIGGISLTDAEAIAGNLAVFTYYDLSTTSWISRKIVYGVTIPTGLTNQTVRFSATNVLSADTLVTSDGAGNKKISKSLVIGAAGTPTNTGLVLSASATETGNYNSVNGPSHISSGSNNKISGSTNTVGGSNNAVSGGPNNVAGSFNNVGGGVNTVAGSYNHVVAGNSSVAGTGNGVTGDGHTLAAAAQYNQISGRNHSVSGSENTVSGRAHAITPTGVFFTAIKGWGGAAINGYSDIQAAFQDVTPGHAQKESIVIAGKTTDATPLIVPLNLGRTALASNSSCSFEVKVTGIQTGGGAGTAGDTKSFTVNGMAKNIGGTLSLVGSPATSNTFNDAAAAAWVGAVTVNNTFASLDVTVTGEASKNINWTVAYLLVKAGY